MTIVGVSFNKPESNAEFIENEQFQYELWSDTEKTLALYYGAAITSLDLVPQRKTKLLDAAGTLVLEYNSVDVNGHPAAVLEDCQVLFGK